MIRTILLSFALFLGTNLLAQKPAAKAKSTITPGLKTSASTSAGSSTNGTAANPPACYAGKTWKLTKVEKFGVSNDPGADQKGDMLQLNTDGTFKIILKGVEKTGTYSRGGWLNLKPADGSEALPIKIESCDGSTLKADWRDGDTHNHFTYGL
jgi:hypothetical protein